MILVVLVGEAGGLELAVLAAGAVADFLKLGWAAAAVWCRMSTGCRVPFSLAMLMPLGIDPMPLGVPSW